MTPLPFGTSRGIILMQTWRTLHPRRILHASGAISVYRGVSPGEPRTWILQSGSECSADRVISPREDTESEMK